MYTLSSKFIKLSGYSNELCFKFKMLITLVGQFVFFKQETKFILLTLYIIEPHLHAAVINSSIFYISLLCYC